MSLVSHEDRYRKRGRRGGPVNPPPCRFCSSKATWRIHIKTSWFRGDDEVMAVCDVHRKTFHDGAWPESAPCPGGAVSAPARPRIVCLCGSTRFGEAFRRANLEETLAGRIVLTVGCDFKSDDALGLGLDVKMRLDQLHFRKIDLADEVLVLDVNGYVGESTRNEIAYATTLGKPIRYYSREQSP